MKSLTILSSGLLVSALLGCAHGACNNLPQRPVATANTMTNTTQDTLADTPPSDNSTSSTKSADSVAPKKEIPKDAVQVFKPTGDLQCEAGKGSPLEKVQAELVQKKIEVYESHTQPDGLMHMTLCGSPSGTIHVFTIAKKDLKRAQRLGFKTVKGFSYPS